MRAQDTDSRTLLRFPASAPFGADAIRGLEVKFDLEIWDELLDSARWYGAKYQAIAEVATRISAVIPRKSGYIALAFLDVTDSAGQDATWFVPFVFERKPVRKAQFAVDVSDGTTWYGTEATGHPAFQAWLLESVAADADVEFEGSSRVQWRRTTDSAVPTGLSSRLLSGEQSNSSIIYGDQLIIKVVRRVSYGLNPEVELGRYLARQPDMTSVPELVADWTLTTPDGEASLGVAQRFMAGSQDGWKWLLEELKHADSNPSRQATILDAIADLGAATAELHMALAQATEPGIAPEPITADDLTAWTRGTLEAMDFVGDVLSLQALESRDQPQRLELFEAALTAWPIIGAGVVGHEASTGLPKIRVHGDYHLGQTLRQGKRWLIIDFEGEPARPLAERRARFSPLKDVAGMLRSLDYAKAMSVVEGKGWIDETNALNDAFVEGYRAAFILPGVIPATRQAFHDALRPWVIDKAMYEIRYELDNRPDWLLVPLMALMRYTFLDSVGGNQAGGSAEP